MKYPTCRIISKHLYFENPMMSDQTLLGMEEEKLSGDDDDSYIVGGTPAAPGFNIFLGLKFDFFLL